MEYEARALPSVLDRLIDRDPDVPRDPPMSRAESLRRLRRAVQRDIEDLLNARNAHHDLPADFVETSRSVVTYGLADVSALNVVSAADQTRLRQLIEHTVRVFEPRLAGVTTTLLPTSPRDGALRLRLDARLLIEPAPEPVSFDVVMPLTTQKYEVTENA